MEYRCENPYPTIRHTIRQRRISFMSVWYLSLMYFMMGMKIHITNDSFNRTLGPSTFFRFLRKKPCAAHWRKVFGSPQATAPCWLSSNAITLFDELEFERSCSVSSCKCLKTILLFRSFSFMTNPLYRSEKWHEINFSSPEQKLLLMIKKS